MWLTRTSLCDCEFLGHALDPFIDVVRAGNCHRVPLGSLSGSARCLRWIGSKIALTVGREGWIDSVRITCWRSRCTTHSRWEVASGTQALCPSSFVRWTRRERMDVALPDDLAAPLPPFRSEQQSLPPGCDEQEPALLWSKAPRHQQEDQGWLTLGQGSDLLLLPQTHKKRFPLACVPWVGVQREGDRVKGEEYLEHAEEACCFSKAPLQSHRSANARLPQHLQPCATPQPPPSHLTNGIDAGVMLSRWRAEMAAVSGVKERTMGVASLASRCPEHASHR